jgi:hypothetical protein
MSNGSSNLESLATSLIQTFGIKENENNWTKIDTILQEIHNKLKNFQTNQNNPNILISFLNSIINILVQTVFSFFSDTISYYF